MEYLAVLWYNSEINHWSVLVSQGDITYLQIVDSMIIVVLVLDGMGKGEKLKVPHHASAAATHDNHMPYS